MSVLPKLVPLVAACLEGSTSSDDGSSVVPPPPVVAMGALGVLEALAFLLRSTMRPHVKRLQDVTALWLQVYAGSPPPFGHLQLNRTRCIGSTVLRSASPSSAIEQ